MSIEVYTALYILSHNTMNNSILLAQIIGVLYLSVGIGMLVSKSHYQKLFQEFKTSATLIYIGGMMAILFGFIILHMNNVWEMSYIGVITLIGWIGIIKGIILLVKPDILMNQMPFWTKYLGFASTIVILVGLMFSYYGFMA